MTEHELYTAVMKAIKNGCDVEIRASKDGGIKIFEIKKNKVL